MYIFSIKIISPDSKSHDSKLINLLEKISAHYDMSYDSLTNTISHLGFTLKLKNGEDYWSANSKKNKFHTFTLSLRETISYEIDIELLQKQKIKYFTQLISEGFFDYIRVYKNNDIEVPTKYYEGISHSIFVNELILDMPVFIIKNKKNSIYSYLKSIDLINKRNNDIIKFQSNKKWSFILNYLKNDDRVLIDEELLGRKCLLSIASRKKYFEDLF